MFKQRFMQLLDEYFFGNQKEFCNKTGIPTGTVNGWITKNNEPNSSILIKIADCFNVTTDYLLGRESDHGTIEIKGYELKPYEENFLHYLNKLNDDGKLVALGYIARLITKPEYADNLGR